MVFLAGLLVLSFVATGAGLQWRSHYFVLMLPAVAILAGAAVGQVRDLAALAANPFARRAVAAPLVVFLGVFGYAVHQERAALFTLTPVELCRAMYGANPFPESLEVARYLREHTGPEDPIVVIGSEPQVYFYAHRRSATGYIYMYSFMEPQPYARQMQAEMIGEIEKAHPAYIVVVAVAASWGGRADSNAMIFQWLNRYGPANYELVGLVDILSYTETAYYWDQEANRKPESSCFLRVFRARAR